MRTRFRAARPVAMATLAAVLLAVAAGAQARTRTAPEDVVPMLFPALGEGITAPVPAAEAEPSEAATSPGLCEPGGFLVAGVDSSGLEGANPPGASATRYSESDVAGSDKSPGLAFVLSLAVPGSGEYYGGSLKRAALFFGIEVATQGMRFYWTGKGNDLEDDFRAVANEEWDPRDYLLWRTSTISRFSSITHALPCSAYVANLPSNVDIGKALRGCSSAEKQQYYELVGKYDQYIAGWSDVRDRDGNPVQPTEVDSAENYLSELRLQYEDDRNESNKYLKRASNISGFILVNHVLSAIDAARVARARAAGASEAAIERRTRLAFVLRGDPASGRGMPMVLAYRPLY